MTLGELLIIVLKWLQDNWVVPAAIVALYIYGRYHFNSPEYALKITDKDGRPLAEAGQLISMTPPRITTSRTRFERFAFGYVLILSLAFICIVFLPELVNETGKILEFHFQVPGLTEKIEHRALFALFAVTGALSSFPYLKEIDRWILKKLHQAALIPYEAERLAKQLYDADLVSETAALGSIQGLNCRDAIRVSEGRASGSLESALLKAMWLKSRLLEITASGGKYLQFGILVQRDLSDIASISSSLRSDLVSYFKTQEEIVPLNVENIDNFINTQTDKPEVRALQTRRQQLLQVCTALYYRECLITALLVYATQFTPTQVEEALKEEIGFQIEVTATPAWDWDTVVKVVGCILVAALVLGAGFVEFIRYFGLPFPHPITREEVGAAAITETLIYAAILLIAIRLKRYWHFHDRRRLKLPENFLVSIAGFLAAVLFIVAFAASWRESINSAAIYYQSIPYGIAAYFVGIYIDRSMQMKEKTFRLVLWQGALQSVAMFLAFCYSPPSTAHSDIISTMYKAAYLGIEAGCLGMIMALTFQRYYQITEFSPASSQGELVTTMGDYSFQHHGVVPTQYKSP